MRGKNLACARLAPVIGQARLIAANRRAATLNRVPRIVSGLALCFTAAALLVGCGQSSIGAAKPAPPADIETRATPQKPRELPRLLAPPPKYGNKIVMARASSNEYRN